MLLELLLVLLGRHLLICEEKEGREGWTEVGTAQARALARAQGTRARLRTYASRSWTPLRGNSSLVLDALEGRNE